MASKYVNLNQDNSIIDSLTRFNGFYTNVYRDPFISGNAFVFVTKPLLFLDPIKPAVKEYKRNMAYMNMTRDPVFTQFLKTEQLNDMDDSIIKSLSYIENYTESNFLPIFTNECKSFDIQDVTLEQYDAFETKQGHKQVLPSHKTMSEAANNISISVTEDSNLSFTKMLTLWVNYIANITDGTFDANPDMVLNGCLDYMCSIFYFVLEPDGKTLKYWCKYTGCWPTTIPYSPLNYSKGSNEPVDLSIPFQYMVKEDMNPRILEDFNTIALNLTGENKLEYIIDDYYSALGESPLLNREMLLQFKGTTAKLFLESSRRDPIILFKDRSTKGIHSDSTNKKFELIFDDKGYQSELMNSILGEDANKYYINDSKTNEYAKSGEDLRWDMSSYWTEFGGE